MKTNMTMTLSVLAVLLAGCGRDTEKSDIKFAGVGVDPQQVGPTPSMYGGIVEYDWADFAGAGLPLGLLGLVSYEAVGPTFNDYKPPYALVNGLAFVMQDDVPAADVLYGNFPVGPVKIGECHVNYHPSAYISNLADIGDKIEIRSEESSSGWDIGRRPQFYPTDVRDVFPYYMELESWRPNPLDYKALASDATSLADFTDTTAQGPNFAFGEKHNVDFTGGVPPLNASWGSIPMPLATAGSVTTFTTPSRPEGVMLSWNGPRYDAHGGLVADGEQVNTCMQFFAPDAAPADSTECLTQADPPTPTDASDAGTYPMGQMYTGPWDTTDGVTFTWIPADESIDQTMTIGIRFLGPVNEEEQYKQEAVVTVPPSSDVMDEWDSAINSGLIPLGTPVPDGRRQAQSCDDRDQVEWMFDDNLLQDDGEYLVGLRGDPSNNLVELACTVDPSAGSFTITPEMLADAYGYAQQHGAQGAVFSVANTTTLDLVTPPVRDRWDHRHDIGPVRVVSNAAMLGRFWFED